MVVRVLVCDESPIVRDGLWAMLDGESDIDVVDTVDSGTQALVLTRRLRPDVIVTGLRLQGMTGLELLRRLAQEPAGSQPQVVVLQLDGGDTTVTEILCAGASGLLTRNATAEEFGAAIRAAGNGYAALTPEVAHQLLQWYREHHGSLLVPDILSSALTPRERQILLLIARGLSTEQVADELGIATTTVRTHVHRLRAKLQLRDRAQLVSYAFQAGLVTSA